MINPKNIAFTEKPILNRGVVVGKEIQGTLELSMVMRLDELEIRQAKFGLEEYVKDQIRARLWHRVYGELFTPVHDLREHAMRNASSWEACEQTKKLAYNLLSLLDLPK